ESLPAIKDFATFIFQSLDRMLNEINRILVDQRSHHCLAIERVSDWQTLVSGKQFIANFRCNGFVHDYTPRGSATLSGRADSAEEDRLRSHIDVGARRDNKRVVAAKFHDQTATGKLNAVITAMTPSGCHCSISRWLGRSDWIVRPYNMRDWPTAKSQMSIISCTSPSPSAMIFPVSRVTS